MVRRFSFSQSSWPLPPTNIGLPAAVSGAIEPGERASIVGGRYGYHRNMDLAEKKIAILVDNFYQGMEVWYPLFRFQEARATVITVGATAGETYASKLGYPVKCQLSYDDVKAADFDGVVVPGRLRARSHPAPPQSQSVRT